MKNKLYKNITIILIGLTAVGIFVALLTPSPKPAKVVTKTITVESPSCKIAKAENLTYEDIVDNDNDELTLIAGFFENMAFYLENPTATHKIAKKLAYFTLNRESLLNRIKNQK